MFLFFDVLFALFVQVYCKDCTGAEVGHDILKFLTVFQCSGCEGRSKLCAMENMFVQKMLIFCSVTEYVWFSECVDEACYGEPYDFISWNRTS